MKTSALFTSLSVSTKSDENQNIITFNIVLLCCVLIIANAPALKLVYGEWKWEGVCICILSVVKVVLLNTHFLIMKQKDKKRLVDFRKHNAIISTFPCFLRYVETKKNTWNSPSANTLLWSRKSRIMVSNMDVLYPSSLQMHGRYCALFWFTEPGEEEQKWQQEAACSCASIAIIVIRAHWIEPHKTVADVGNKMIGNCHIWYGRHRL